MGLVEKSLTRNRIKPKEYSTNLPGPYLVKGQLAAAQLIRSVAFAIAEEIRRVSVAHPVWALSGIGLALEYDYTIWFAQLDERTWEVAFLVGSTRRIPSTESCDWVVHFRLNADASGFVLNTPKVSVARDGKQIRRGHYQAFIDFARTAINASEPPTPRIELEVTRRGLASDSSKVSELVDGVEHQSRRWRTQLSLDEISIMVESMPIAVICDGPASWVLQVGLDRQELRGSASIVARDEGSVRCLHYRSDMLNAGSEIADGIAACRAFGVGVLISTLLQTLDPDTCEEIAEVGRADAGLGDGNQVAAPDESSREA
jgi:hypothetical protein